MLLSKSFFLKDFGDETRETRWYMILLAEVSMSDLSKQSLRRA